MFKLVEKTKCELEGPYECTHCGGHLMIDSTYLDQVNMMILCPYCGTNESIIDNEEEGD